jgi:transaldolase
VQGKYDFIIGQVLVQTSPSQVYNTQATVEHAKMYDNDLQQCGIARERFCIKIPATGSGVIAMQELTHFGISVLGTAVFCVEQAIACSQAGCINISPSYNGKISP